MKYLIIIIMLIGITSCATLAGIDRCKRACRTQSVDRYVDDEIECTCHVTKK